jgi:hypothetical protein
MQHSQGFQRNKHQIVSLRYAALDRFLRGRFGVGSAIGFYNERNAGRKYVSVKGRILPLSPPPSKKKSRVFQALHNLPNIFFENALSPKHS